MSNKYIGLTGPSAFTPDLIKMVEEFLEYNFVLLYQNRMENVEQWLQKCDGVIFSGGIDIHPSVYDQNVQTNVNLKNFDYGRDQKELLIIDYCFSHHKPMLGICRGHQLMSIYKGLRDDFIIDLDGSVVHQPSKYQISFNKNETAHRIDLHDPHIFEVPDPPERKVIRDLLGEKKRERPCAWVNSYHHQGVKWEKAQKEQYLKRNIKVLATAPSGMKDDSQIIEMMMGMNNQNHWITVQFHPEADWEENSASRLTLGMFRKMLENQYKEK